MHEPENSSQKRVRLLSPELIHRIAAGEVVDKPASVVKELIENSIDAGAANIRVTVVGGGLREILIEDDGHGFRKADLKVAVQRHATSKIASLEDLDSIFSLGFRGEALSAVASVSRLGIQTTHAADGSWELEVTAGQRSEVKPSAWQNGTRISVKDLFFNVPARLKFLKRPLSEGMDCLDVFESMALAHPGVSLEFFLIDESGEVRKNRNYRATELPDRFESVHREQGDSLHIVSIDHQDEGLKRIEIAAYKAPVLAQNQKKIRLSVNGRVISDKRLPFALREAYAGLIEIGSYPVVQVNLQVDPKMIDANIHPQKKEVRWPQSFSLASRVYSLLRPQFEIAQRPSVQLPVAEPLSFEFASSVETGAPIMEPALDPAPSPARPHPPLPGPRPAVAASVTASANFTVARSPRPPFRFSELRVVGEALASWIVCESAGGLVLLDQHAAHERVNFERALTGRNLLRSKALLIPMEVPIPLEVTEEKRALRETLESFGFECLDENLDVKRDTMTLIAVPEADRGLAWGTLLEQIFTLTNEAHDPKQLRAELEVRIAASIACHGSVKRGQRLSTDSIRELLRDLDEVEWGGLCPHGRPLWFELTHQQLEDAFHR